ncbi:MAG: hypothetical protein JST40_11495 [Armatimonadetes bacterium]|nr:hypothetical protein [Armatimonadota bacterium]
MKTFATALALMSLSAAFAMPSQTMQGVLEPAKNLKVATPDAAWRVDRNGNRISPIYYPSMTNDFTRNAAVYVPIFDLWNTNPTTLPAFAAHNANYYGTNTGNYRLANEYRAYNFVASMKTLAPGTDGRAARYFAIGTCWNPGGTTTRSGSANLVQTIYPFSHMDTTGYGPAGYGYGDGLAFSFTNLAAGFYILTYNLANFDASGDALSLNATQNDGGLLVFNNGTSGANLAAPISAQPILKSFASGTLTVPFDAENLHWADRSTYPTPWDGVAASASNTPNYIFEDGIDTYSLTTPYSERLTVTGATATEFVRPAVSMFADDGTRSIRGKVSVPDGIPAPPIAGIVITRSTGTIEKTIGLGADGSFEIVDPNQAAGGSYTINIKPNTWLSQTFTADTTAGSVSGLEVACPGAGDIDNDNSVTIFDYVELSTNFDLAKETDVLWGYIVTPAVTPTWYSDLDGDGAITIFDYVALSNSFDLFGQ